MARVLETVAHVAPGRAPVLIEGERGVGKRWLAVALHAGSPRAPRPFVACGGEGLPETELERELFGDRDQSGAIESAEGGTLLVEEVGALTPALQARLLRLSSDREFERAGESAPRRADVRLLASSSSPLEPAVAAGRFRDDLFQRLAAVRVRVPALRERAEDLPLLVHALLEEIGRVHRRTGRTLTPGALEALAQHGWPGNVRELRGVLEGMIVFAGRRRVLELGDLPPSLRAVGGEAGRVDVRVGMTVEEAERQLILATLQRAGQDKPRAAAMLGIGLRTLYRKLRLYHVG